MLLSLCCWLVFMLFSWGFLFFFFSDFFILFLVVQCSFFVLLLFVCCFHFRSCSVYVCLGGFGVYRWCEAPHSRGLGVGWVEGWRTGTFLYWHTCLHVYALCNFLFNLYLALQIRSMHITMKDCHCRKQVKKWLTLHDTDYIAQEDPCPWLSCVCTSVAWLV